MDNIVTSDVGNIPSSLSSDELGLQSASPGPARPTATDPTGLGYNLSRAELAALHGGDIATGAHTGAPPQRTGGLLASLFPQRFGAGTAAAQTNNGRTSLDAIFDHVFDALFGGTPSDQSSGDRR